MKKYVMGMVAVILALGLSAFTLEKGSSPKPFSGEMWFHFDGTSPGDLNDATKYSLDGNGSAPTVCPTNTSSLYRCEILAPATGSPSVPVIASAIDERKRTTP